MTALTTIAAVLGLLGSALVGGIFLAFTSFVMKALARVPAQEGIAAMQSINVVVLNPSFLGTFAGTAVASIIAPRGGAEEEVEQAAEDAGEEAPAAEGDEAGDEE